MIVWILLLGIVIPIAVEIGLDAYLTDAVWIHFPFHGIIEGFGAFAAFSLAFLILLSERHRANSVYGVWSLGAFTGMGVLDLFHAFSGPGNNFVWMHSLAVCAGGLFLSLSWVPSRLVPPRPGQWLPGVVILTAVGTAILSMSFPEAVPLMAVDGQFSGAARGLNMAGGIFFFIAMLRFMTLYRLHPDGLELMMAGFCALSGIASVMFTHSSLWGPVWWWWHCLRLSAYFVVTGFIILFYQEMMAALHRTNGDLAYANKELQREMLERRQAEDRIREANELNEKILGTVPLPMDIVDEEGQILYVNRVMGAITGRPAIGQRCWSTYKDDKIQCADCPLRKGIPPGQVKSLEVSGALGGRTLQISHTGMTYGGRRAVLEVFQDVTERKHNEEALKNLTADLQRRLEQLKASRTAALNLTQDIDEARKRLGESRDALAIHARDMERANEELEQFAYVVSHDLQEPLRMVASYVQLLAKRYRGRLDADADDFIGFAVDGVKRMQDLINDLLAFSRAGARGKEFVLTDCEEILDTTLQNLETAIAENHAEVTRGPLPKLMADDGQLVHVFQNLIANAVKFRKKEAAPRIHVSCRTENKKFFFGVSDNGIGIAPEHYEKIFQIFQQLHPRDEYPGSGIGLAICKRIVERHGGRIWVESETGKGSTFYFSLPSPQET
jgi:PAS domain S-box-containing protein